MYSYLKAKGKLNIKKHEKRQHSPPPPPIFPETIEELLNSFSPKIIPMMRSHDVIVGGSTAMYYFMKKNGLQPGFKPGDIDVYISSINGKAPNELFVELIMYEKEIRGHGNVYGGNKLRLINEIDIFLRKLNAIHWRGW